MGDTGRAGHPADAEFIGLDDGLVARVRDGFGDLRRLCPRIEPDIGALGREIDARGGDARRARQRFLDMGDAGRAGHAAHVEGELAIGGGNGRAVRHLNSQRGVSAAQMS